MKWDFDSPAAANANRALPLLAREFFKAGRSAVKRGKTPHELHQFRIQTKRFRYALEVFAPLYGPELEKSADKLQQLQRTLGKISDAYTIRDLLSQHAHHKKDLQGEGKKRIADFRKFWREVFDAPGEKRKWMAVLKSAGSPTHKEEESRNEEHLDMDGAADRGDMRSGGDRSDRHVGGDQHAPQRG